MQAKGRHAVATNYQGSCFCGDVGIELVGEPLIMGYCHCRSCRCWSASPLNAFSLWKTDGLKITRGANLVGTFFKSERSRRQFCTSCGGHLMTQKPLLAMVDVSVAIVPDLRFAPALHLFYGERAMSVPDGLPKLFDMPVEFGGSGETSAE
jgi:hypothetical protein